MRFTPISRIAIVVLAVLPAMTLAPVPANAADPPAAFPTRAWTAHQKWDLIVQRFPRNRPGEVAPPPGATKDAPFRMTVLLSGTQRLADVLCWQVDFIVPPDGRPWGQVDNFSLFVGKRAGWPVQVIGLPPGAPAPFQPFGGASMLTSAPEGFPAELFPLNPLEAGAAGSPATLQIRRRTEGGEVVVEAEVRSGDRSELLVRQHWVEGESWWRRYERFVGGEKDLEARLAPPPEAKSADPIPSGPPEPGWLAMLRDDPHLQAFVSVDLKNQPLQALLDLLTEETSLRIELSPELAAAKPLFGSLSGRAPAWQVMQQAAQHNIVAGRWEKTDQGYRLCGDRPVSVAPTQELKSGVNWWLTGPSFVIIPILAIVAFFARRRSLKPKL